jgi:hypothetical protein
MTAKSYFADMQYLATTHDRSNFFVEPDIFSAEPPHRLETKTQPITADLHASD